MDEQIGLEDTYQEYIENLVKVFKEVKRLLKDDGTLWLNMGDTYVGTGQKTKDSYIDKIYKNGRGSKKKPLNNRVEGLKRKDLMGMPWRIAFALQNDGWYLRQDIIWHKPNPMPEPVTDRCTKSHEYIFLLAKNEKYYFDNESIKEDGIIKAGTKGAKGSEERQNEKNVNSRPPEYKIYDGKRNKRSVWKVNTKPFKESHFATFPPKLIEPMILAGCPETGTVLDPFGGAGTTALVADRLNRNAVSIELNEDYIEITKKRLEKDNSLFLKLSD